MKKTILLLFIFTSYLAYNQESIDEITGFKYIKFNDPIKSYFNYDYVETRDNTYL